MTKKLFTAITHPKHDGKCTNGCIQSEKMCLLALAINTCALLSVAAKQSSVAMNGFGKRRVKATEYFFKF